MIQIRSADNELNIEGTNQEFIKLQSAIGQVINTTNSSGVLIRCDEDFDPTPYKTSCKLLQIQLGSGPNQFIVINSTLKIIGSASALCNLSKNLPIVEDGEFEDSIQYHHHYDIYSFPEYVSRNSPEITLSLRQDIQ